MRYHENKAWCDWWNAGRHKSSAGGLFWGTKQSLQCMVGMSPIQAPGNGRGHVYSFCWEQTRHKIITTVQKHEIQLSTDTGVNDIKEFFFRYIFLNRSHTYNNSYTFKNKKHVWISGLKCIFTFSESRNSKMSGFSENKEEKQNICFWKSRFRM